jgi:hypothetical protein
VKISKGVINMTNRQNAQISEVISSGNSEYEEEDKRSKFKRGEHPNSLSNLTPFEKGISGNPLGRPYKFEKLRAILNEVGNEQTYNFRNEEQGTRRERVWKKVWDQAIRGDMKFIQLLANFGCLDNPNK